MHYLFKDFGYKMKERSIMVGSVQGIRLTKSKR
jgi:hypothetical protein